MTASPTRYKIIAAFAAVYLIWGSTYLGIRYAIETIPPLLMAGVRFLIAGGLLYGWTRLRGAPRPTLTHWRAATAIGAMLLLVGNGSVSWAEQVVPSGITALLVASSPLWFVVLEWINRGSKPTIGVVIGLLLGTVGIIVLVDPAKIVGGEEVNLIGAGVLTVAALVWAAGSLHSRTASLPRSPLVGTGMEMLTGGALLVLASLAFGELSDLNLAGITSRSMIALSYLIVFGSIIAFSSYIWLLRVTTPAMASTYAYVNPVVAVFLGWLVASEPLNGRIALAAALIVAAVAAITTFNARRGSRVAKTLKMTGQGKPTVGGIPQTGTEQ